MVQFDGTKTYDRDTFVNSYRSHILPRIPRDMENADTQIALLKTLCEIIPTISAVTPVAETLLRQGGQIPQNRHMLTMQIAALANATIGSNGLELMGDSSRSDFNTLSDDQLLDAFILLD